MTLKPNCGSDRAWVYSVNVDYADEEPKPELLAIKFANAGGEITIIILFILSKTLFLLTEQMPKSGLMPLKRPRK